MMDRKLYKTCIEKEVYGGVSKHDFFHRFYRKYFRAETNAVYLIRKYLYYENSNMWFRRVIAKHIECLLMRRYSISIDPRAEIGMGLHFTHASGFYVANCKIGKNCLVFQNVTLGVSKYGKDERSDCPTIGDRVVLCANSSVIGGVYVTDNSVLGANSCLVKNADIAGTYIGTPAQLKSRKTSIDWFNCDRMKEWILR